MKKFYIPSRLFFLIILCTNFYFNLSAQYSPPAISWQKCLGGTSFDGNTIKMLKYSANSVIIMANSESSDGDFQGLHYGTNLSDIVLIELDYSGNILRKKNFGGTYFDQTVDFITNSDGSIGLVIQTSSVDMDLQGFSAGSKYVLFHLSPNWVVQSRTLLSGFFDVNSIGLSNNSGKYIITGRTSNYNAIVKEYDFQGVISNSKSFSNYLFGLGYFSSISKVIPINQGEYLMSIDCNGGIENVAPCGPGYRTNLVRLDNAFNIISISCNNTVQDKDIVGLKGLSQNRFLLEYPSTFYEKTELTFSNVSPVLLLTQNSIHQTSNTASYICSDSKLVVTGHSTDNSIAGTPTSTDKSFVLYKFDTLYNVLWKKRFGGTAEDVATSVIQNEFGEYIVAGMTYSNDGDVIGNHGGWDIWVLKTGQEFDCSPLAVLPDTTRACGTSVQLNGGSTNNIYLWNTGETTNAITALSSGLYKVTITNNVGCTITDSTYLSLVHANILNSDTTICRGSAVDLAIDSSGFNNSICNSLQLPPNIRNGLVGYWPFCGNANDASGNNNNGTVYGATLTTDRFGRLNSAYSFNSSNANYIRCSGSSLYTSNVMTLSFWINITNYNELSEIICLGDNSGTYWGASVANRIVSLNYGSGCGNGMMTYPTFNFTPNNWYNVTFVANRTLRMNKVYINGQFVGDNPSGVLSGCSINYLYFGVDIFSLPEYFTGKLDDITIWNRELSLTEIQQLSSNNLQAINVQWSTGATTNSITVSSNQSITYYATVTDGITSCIDSVRVNVASVDTTITALDSPQVCTNAGQVRLQAGVASTYQWQSSADGVNFTNIAAATSRIYTATTAGYYRVKVVNSINCLDSSRAIYVTLNPQPVVNFTINTSSQCINGNSFVFTNSTGISSGSMIYFWNFGDGGTATTLNASHTYLIAGNYQVKLIATSNNGCVDSFIRTVTVYAQPLGLINTPSTNIICQGSSVTLSATGGNTYQWLIGGIVIPGAISANYIATQPGQYSVQIISSNSCQSLSANTITLSLIQRPTADFMYSNFCAGFPVQFNNTSTTNLSGTVTNSWNFGDAQTSTLTSPVHVYTSPGSYTASLVVAPIACPSLNASVFKPINIVSPPASLRYSTLNAVSGRNLQLQARVFNGATYLWRPTLGLSSSIISNPIFNYTREQEYKININTNEGCAIVDTVLIRMFKEKDILLPKGFTPNGDGNNDVLVPKLIGIEQLIYFKVYDRWGQLMYQTSTAGEGWNGTYKGVKQPMESYTWMAEGKDVDGIIIKRSGATLLIR